MGINVLYLIFREWFTVDIFTCILRDEEAYIYDGDVDSNVWEIATRIHPVK